METALLEVKNLIREERSDGILTLSFNSTNTHNPFSKEMRDAVIASLQKAKGDTSLRAVILTGGEGRSFCVGGDFNETITFTTPEQVENWIDSVVLLYLSCLELDVPTIAAVDKYAIGIGFQLALTCDWRIGTEQCSFIMPELKNGIACTLGSFMLSHLLGKAQMQKIVFGCQEIPAAEAYHMNLLHEITTSENLLARAAEEAKRLSNFPEIPWSGSKKMINRSFINGLNEILIESKLVHVDSFMSQSGVKFFKKILNKDF